MQALTRHLHAFVREVWLTEQEWQAAIAFLTATGHITHDRRQEFVLLSDALWISMHPLRADYALVKAHRADELGNLVYRKTARNLGPVMAAATTTIVQVCEIVPVGGLDAENVVTPCIYVDRVVHVPVPARAPEPVGAGQ